MKKISLVAAAALMFAGAKLHAQTAKQPHDHVGARYERPARGDDDPAAIERRRRGRRLRGLFELLEGVFLGDGNAEAFDRNVCLHGGVRVTRHRPYAVRLPWPTL